MGILGLDGYLVQKAPGVSSLSPTFPRALPITCNVLLCHRQQRLDEVNDRTTFLLLQVILPRTKLGYISRGGLPVAVPAPVTQVSSCFLDKKRVIAMGIQVLKSKTRSCVHSCPAPQLCLSTSFLPVSSLKALASQCCGSKSWQGASL